MKKNLLLFGASMLTAMGSVLLVLTLVVAVTDNAFAASEGCTGGCVKTVDSKCANKSSGPCTGITGCACPPTQTAWSDCPCGYQN